MKLTKKEALEVRASVTVAVLVTCARLVVGTPRRTMLDAALEHSRKARA